MTKYYTVEVYDNDGYSRYQEYTAGSRNAALILAKIDFPNSEMYNVWVQAGEDD
jgi:hypothetical protein